MCVQMGDTDSSRLALAIGVEQSDPWLASPLPTLQNSKIKAYFCPQRNMLIHWNSVKCNGFQFYYSDMVLLEWNSGHLFHSGLVPYFIQRFKRLHQKSRGLWSLRHLLSGSSHRELTLLRLVLNWQGLLCFLRRHHQKGGQPTTAATGSNQQLSSPP